MGEKKMMYYFGNLIVLIPVIATILMIRFITYPTLKQEWDDARDD
jgi:hypothetical protein